VQTLVREGSSLVKLRKAPDQVLDPYDAKQVTASEIVREVEQVGDPVKETVIIVHGTWAAPKPDKAQWYQPIDRGGVPDGFVSKLNNALQERGSSARCWAHCTLGKHFFQWSGENSWIARMRAASALAAYVRQLQIEGWRCHIVAHSHGGNVVIDALSQIAAADQSDGHSLKIVTLGTPFIDISSSVSERRKEARTLRAAASYFATLGVLTCLILITTMGLIGDDLDFTVGGVLFVLLLIFIGIRVYAGRPRAFGDATFPSAEEIQNRFKSWFNVGLTAHPLREADGINSQLLAIGSRRDEPWQILYHMRSADNPLAISTNLVRYVFSSLRLHMRAAAEADDILGAKSFKTAGLIRKTFVVVSCALLLIGVGLPTVAVATSNGSVFLVTVCVIVTVLCFIATIYFLLRFTRDRDWRQYNSPYNAPARWLGHLLDGLLSVPTDVLTYLIRRKSWSVLVGIAMGLEHYRFELPRVQQLPNFRFNCLSSYEDIPTAALERAELRRSDWIARHLGSVSATFAELAITAADISSLLRTIEQDQSLIHASYYTDDECIARIADWIAGRE
jgi:hypothetical protein